MSQEMHLCCITQIIEDWRKKSWADLRILDLACLEGVYSTELALQGAKVVGIEGRKANLIKADFVKNALEISNLEYVLDDVRNLSVEKYGKFDVIICAGILYHLDQKDIYPFLKQIYETCEGILILDTHFTQSPTQEVIYEGVSYAGSPYLEHQEESSQEERLKLLHASLHNSFSFWLTRSSLLNILSRLGFTTVQECLVPALLNEYEDRGMFIATKGKRTSLITVSEVGLKPYPLYDENKKRKASLLDSSSKTLSLARRIKRKAFSLFNHLRRF
jgi:hypothetical protein